VKPLDEVMLHEIFQNYDKVITVEDGCIQGGFGSAVGEFMLDNGYSSQLKRLGMPDRVVEHGEQIELHKECGFDPEGIAEAVRAILGTVKMKQKTEEVSLILN
jgi:1-deoxy-D-xylulose-5-phosphate synthase